MIHSETECGLTLTVFLDIHLIHRVRSPLQQLAQILLSSTARYDGIVAAKLAVKNSKNDNGFTTVTASWTREVP